jgi:crossover junction endonuclease EME1
MPEIIDLISSDPPLPEKPRPQNEWQATRPLPSRGLSNLGTVSSDSIDVSLFNYDDIFDKPTKKRRVSNERRSPLRKTTSTNETTITDRVPSFLFSDEDFGLPPSNNSATRRQPAGNVEDLDPITWNSSQPLPLPKSKLSARSRDPVCEFSDIITLDGDVDHLKPQGRDASRVGRQEEIEEFSDPFAGLPEFSDVPEFQETGVSHSTGVFSSKTAELLSNPSTTGKRSGILSPQKTGARSRNSKNDDVMGLWLSDDMEEPAQPKRPAKKTNKLTTEEKEAKAKARADAKVQKELEKEMEKEKKKQLREDKAKQKQLEADISEVNKLKVDKKDSTPEMILDMASSFEGGAVGNQAIEFMRRLGVDHHFFTSPIPQMVKWRRKMNARFNEDAGHWEPCPFYIQTEKHVLCLVPAQDFVDMVIPSPDGEEREPLELHVLRIKSAHPECTVIYLIEGLMGWMRKNRNSRNRAYQAEVLRQYEPTSTQTSTTSSRGRKKKNKPETTPPVDDDTIEDALLELQVSHASLIHHTNTPSESAEWIKNFTEHISTIPYRQQRSNGNDAAFCMDVGQVKTGEDKQDTFVKMLQEVNRVTAPMAYGIAGQYPSVTDLVRNMRTRGPTMLEDVMVCPLSLPPFLSLFFAFDSTHPHHNYSAITRLRSSGISLTLSRNPLTRTAASPTPASAPQPVSGCTKYLQV